MVFSQVKARYGAGDSAAIPSISPPAHRLAAFLHKSSTGSCTERSTRMSPAEPTCEPPRLPCCVCPARWSHDVTRLVVSRTLPPFAAFVPTGFAGTAATRWQQCIHMQGSDLSSRVPACCRRSAILLGSCAARPVGLCFLQAPQRPAASARCFRDRASRSRSPPARPLASGQPCH